MNKQTETRKGPPVVPGKVPKNQGTTKGFRQCSKCLRSTKHVEEVEGYYVCWECRLFGR